MSISELGYRHYHISLILLVKSKVKTVFAPHLWNFISSLQSWAMTESNGRLSSRWSVHLPEFKFDKCLANTMSPQTGQRKALIKNAISQIVSFFHQLFLIIFQRSYAIDLGCRIFFIIYLFSKCQQNWENRERSIVINGQ